MTFTDGNDSFQLVFAEKCFIMPEEREVKPTGEGVRDCLEEMSRPPTPPVVKKFYNSIHPEPGAVRVHRGKADDPDVASDLVHGIITKTPLNAGSLLYPPQKTFLQQKLEEFTDSEYPSRKKAPLGRSPEQCAELAGSFDDKTVFGVKIVRGLDIGKIINPPQTEENEKESQKIHEAYVLSHDSYYPGEQKNRKYDLTHFNKDSMFGIETPHSNDGRNLGKTLHWRGHTLKFYNPNPPWKRSESKEKLANQFGKTMNLETKTSNLPPDHSFGLFIPRDQYGLAETIHCAEPGHYMRSSDKQASLVSALRSHLKNMNFFNFPSLLTAFGYYDKKGRGMIDKEDLRETFKEMQLDVSEGVLDDLMNYCDTDKDGLLNFMEFSNFLNWKNMMPINPREQCILTNASIDMKSCTDPEKNPPCLPLIKTEDLKSIKPESPVKIVKSLRRPRTVLDDFTTSSSVIGAVCGTSSNDRPSGIPSVRSDLPAPRIKRVSDTTNYGDSSTARNLINPSVYALRGVHEEQFFSPRSKEEIAGIFRNVGMNISEETFEAAWNLTSMMQPNGEVCLDAILNVLKEIKACNA